MHRIDTPTAQTDKFGVGKNGFTRGNPQTGVPATALDDDYFDAVQEELAGVIEAADIVLDKSNRAQVLAAIKKLIDSETNTKYLKIANNLVEIKNAGTAAVAATLANLGLKGASLRDVGAGANQIPDMNSFGVSFGASGYQKFPGGLILQWGRVTTTAALIGAQWNFPIPFPNEVLSYFAMTENSSGDSKYSNIGPISAASRTGATVSSTYPGAASNSCWALGR